MIKEWSTEHPHHPEEQQKGLGQISRMIPVGPRQSNLEERAVTNQQNIKLPNLKILQITSSSPVILGSIHSPCRLHLKS